MHALVSHASIKPADANFFFTRTQTISRMCVCVCVCVSQVEKSESDRCQFDDPTLFRAERDSSLFEIGSTACD